MSFSSRLKALRVEKGLTQEALARLAGLSTSGVAKIENSGLDPAWSTVVKLADALGVSFESFRDEAAVEARPARRKKGI